MRDDFTVTALIAAFNEADVIAEVIEHLIAQSVTVYVIDDGSTDATAAIAERYVGRGVLEVERWPQRPEGSPFCWADILRRKEALASQVDSSWFIHHDADELRFGPTRALDLRDAIREID